MSVQSEINRLTANVAAAYSMAGQKGAIMPSNQNSDNLASTIGSIAATVSGTVLKLPFGKVSGSVLTL